MCCVWEFRDEILLREGGGCFMACFVALIRTVLVAGFVVLLGTRLGHV